MDAESPKRYNSRMDEPITIAVPVPVSQLIANTLIHFKGNTAQMAEAIERAILTCYTIEPR